MSLYARVLSMRKALAVIFVSITFSVFAYGQTAASYIGYEYKGVTPDTVMPNGLKHLGGGLISDPYVDPVYGVTQVSQGNSWMLWLQVSVGQNALGVTSWRVLDVLSFPKPRGSEYIMLAPDPSIECTRSGKAVSRLSAVGRINRRSGTFTPQRAWTADLAKKKFTPASIRGLRCTYSEP